MWFTTFSVASMCPAFAVPPAVHLGPDLILDPPIGGRLRGELRSVKVLAAGGDPSVLGAGRS